MCLDKAVLAQGGGGVSGPGGQGGGGGGGGVAYQNRGDVPPVASSMGAAKLDEGGISKGYSCLGGYR